MSKNNKIAIIGMSALFPGSETLDGFWQNLLQEKDLTSTATKNDFGVAPERYYDDKKGTPDRCYSFRGGFIRDFKFNTQGFQKETAFLQNLDVLYQWGLHVSREALRHAGYHRPQKNVPRCGVMIGNLSFPTGSSHRLLSDIYASTIEQGLKELFINKNISVPNAQIPVPENDPLQGDVAQLIKESLGLEGIALDLDAACASSLYAIKLACDELLTHKADMMLAGAVCGSDQFFIHMGFSIFHAYAHNNDKFVPFDKKSGGLVSSEGTGMVVLKRLADAERDGDTIFGVIAGVGLSNDGKGKFLLSPNPKGQILAFERAYESTGLNPTDTSYIECHATGTPLGDVTEINSIETFFIQHQNKPLLGSVKSNMGHLLTAAGMTGLFKVILAMQKGIIPPNIHMNDPIDTDKGWITGQQIIQTPTAWSGNKLQAGVNSFGFGGTNAHLIVEKYTENTFLNTQNSPATSEKPIDIVPLAITGMEAHFGDCTNLADFYHTIYTGKQHFRSLPKNRWKGIEANKSLLKKYKYTANDAPKGNYISEFEIDLLRYKIQPKEAETLEPQQALILKVADKAIQEAGLKEGQNVAVIIAMAPELAIHHYLARWDAEWQLEEAFAKAGIRLKEEEKNALLSKVKHLIFARKGDQTPSQHTSFVGNIMASRIAALWDFTGPAFTITNGNDSVFRALEIAQTMLSKGEVEAVVLGGVDFSGGLENVLLHHQKSPLHSFDTKPSLSVDKNNKGWLIGEGAGVIILKNAHQIGPNEPYYAVIEDVGAIKENLVYDYCELNATGFQAEDKQELIDLFQHRPANAVALGSVKANIGNTFAAAGIAAIIKTALCLRYQFVPPIPNWDAPRQAALFAKTNYYFPTTARPWLKNPTTQTRHALIRGTHTAISMREGASIAPPKPLLLRQFSPQLFIIKGHNLHELQQQLSDLEAKVATTNGKFPAWNNLIAAFQQANSPLHIVLIAPNPTILAQEIKRFQQLLPNAFAQSKAIQTPQGSYFTPNPTRKTGDLAFVYPGSATAYQGLGSDIFQLFPELLRHYEAKIDDLHQYIATQYLYPQTQTAHETTPPIQQNAIAMMSAGVFFSSVYTHVLRHYFKIKPAAALGYSMGECSSMHYSLGHWKPEEAALFRSSPIFKDRFAGRLDLLAETWGVSSDEARQNWVSLILLVHKAQVEPLIAAHKNVYLTFINTDKEVIISGNKTNCYAIAKALDVVPIEVPFQNIIHHSFCRNETEGLLAMHRFPLQERPAIDFYSSIKNDMLPQDSQAIAENSTAVCCQKVDFPALIHSVFHKGVNNFVEIGANSTCTNWIKDILKENPHAASTFDKKGLRLSQTILTTLAQLISNGYAVKIDYLYENENNALPLKTFQYTIKTGGEQIIEGLNSMKINAPMDAIYSDSHQ